MHIAKRGRARGTTTDKGLSGLATDMFSLPGEPRRAHSVAFWGNLRDQMKSREAKFAVIVLLACAGCSPSPDFGDAREAVKLKLRDPSSSEFRDEKIRTLWSANGDRLTVYCAEVNANNAFGGKAGFQPVEYVVAVTATSPKPGDPAAGDVWQEVRRTILIANEPTPSAKMEPCSSRRRTCSRVPKRCGASSIGLCR